MIIESFIDYSNISCTSTQEELEKVVHKVILMNKAH